MYAKRTQRTPCFLLLFLFLRLGEERRGEERGKCMGDRLSVWLFLFLFWPVFLGGFFGCGCGCGLSHSSILSSLSLSTLFWGGEPTSNFFTSYKVCVTRAPLVSFQFGRVSILIPIWVLINNGYYLASIQKPGRWFSMTINVDLFLGGRSRRYRIV